jgi:hypothetical protein
MPQNDEIRKRFIRMPPKMPESGSQRLKCLKRLKRLNGGVAYTGLFR